jgi:prevent-host-death family protein
MDIHVWNAPPTRASALPTGLASHAGERPRRSQPLAKSGHHDYIVLVMKTISISELKSRLSEQLRRVRRGQEIVVTDRGDPVARLVPYDSDHFGLEELAARGEVAIGRRKLPRGFFARKRPGDPRGLVRAALDEERNQSR